MFESLASVLAMLFNIVGGEGAVPPNNYSNVPLYWVKLHPLQPLDFNDFQTAQTVYF